MSLQTYFTNPTHSTVQEQLVETWFIRDYILHTTRQGQTPLVAHSDIDLFGFDLILGLRDRDQLLRVQLKAFNGRTRIWDVHKALLQQGGLVVIANPSFTGAEPTITYRCLTPEGRIRALSRTPRKAHPGKCMVKFGDVKVVDDLLQLFEM
jgi:hypothetical protein